MGSWGAKECFRGYSVISSVPLNQSRPKRSGHWSPGQTDPESSVQPATARGHKVTALTAAVTHVSVHVNRPVVQQDV